MTHDIAWRDSFSALNAPCVSLCSVCSWENHHQWGTRGHVGEWQAGHLHRWCKHRTWARLLLWVTLTWAILHPLLIISNCRGWKMATRCAETSSEYGLCHMVAGKMLGGCGRRCLLHCELLFWWRHLTLSFAPSNYKLMYVQAPLSLAKAEVTWHLGVSHDLASCSVVSSAAGCFNLTPSWKSKHFTELLWLKPHPPLMPQCTGQYTVASADQCPAEVSKNKVYSRCKVTLYAGKWVGHLVKMELFCSRNWYFTKYLWYVVTNWGPNMRSTVRFLSLVEFCWKSL